MNSRDLAVDALRKDLILEGQTDPNGGGWSDPVIQCLRPGHRDLRDSLEHIASASDLFATPRQRSLARQALGLGSGTSISAETNIGEGELFEAMARGL